jgi:hypothetical protein
MMRRGVLVRLLVNRGLVGDEIARLLSCFAGVRFVLKSSPGGTVTSKRSSSKTGDTRKSNEIRSDSKEINYEKNYCA